MRVVAVLDKSFGLHFTSLDGHAIWLAESPANRAFLDNQPEPSRESVLFTVDQSPDDQIILDLVEAISQRHPEWTEIDVVGIFPNHLLVSKLVAPRGAFGGTYVTELSEIASDNIRPLGFKLTKTPPATLVDRMETWRRNLPPAGLLSITEPALRRIVNIRDNLRNSKPGPDWIPSLNWGSGAVKGPNDDDWRDCGVGFALGFSPRSDFPFEAIELRGGIEIVFRLGFDYAFFEGKMVDFIEGTGFVLVER